MIHVCDVTSVYIVLQNLKDGQSALFHVVVKGQKRVDLVEKMLEQGADPNIQDAVSIIFCLTIVTLITVSIILCLFLVERLDSTDEGGGSWK